MHQGTLDGKRAAGEYGLKAKAVAQRIDGLLDVLDAQEVREGE